MHTTATGTQLADYLNLPVHPAHLLPLTFGVEGSCVALRTGRVVRLFVDSYS